MASLALSLRPARRYVSHVAAALLVLSAAPALADTATSAAYLRNAAWHHVTEQATDTPRNVNPDTVPQLRTICPDCVTPHPGPAVY